MRRPGTDENNVQMSDVLCDFCRGEWTEEVPMVEGHQGSCICGKCLTIAYTEVVLNEISTAPTEYKCVMCLETNGDRAVLKRENEPGWLSPMYEEAVICRRCIKQSAGVLHRSPDFQWRKPT